MEKERNKQYEVLKAMISVILAFLLLILSAFIPVENLSKNLNIFLSLVFFFTLIFLSGLGIRFLIDLKKPNNSYQAKEKVDCENNLVSNKTK